MFKKNFDSLNTMFMRYIIVGIITTTINFAMYFSLFSMGINYLLTNTIAWLVSVVFAFFANKHIVFESKSTTVFQLLKESISFVVLRIVSLAVDDGLMFLFISIIGIPSWLAKLITQVVVIISNYLFSKLIFKTNNTP